MKSVWEPTQPLEQATNFKEYFMLHDCLQHLTTELAFSVFKRYKCNAGCDVCYIKDKWETDPSLFVPDHLPIQQILDTFELFDVVTTIDDLYLLKNTYPDLFQFYVDHAHTMSNSSMTDIAIIQQADIVMSLDFKSVYEVTVSDSFLSKHPDLTDVILDKLEQLHADTCIEKVKLIAKSKNSEYDPNIQRIIEWADKNNLAILVHDDITTNKRSRFKLAHKSNQATNFYAEHSHPYLVLNESVYLQCDQFFLSIADAVLASSVPFASLPITEDVSGFIYNGLLAKVKCYDKQSTQISSMHNKYYDYFTFVSTSVIVNEQFSFIPNYVLRKGSRLHDKLLTQGFVDLPIGLMKNGADPKLLFEISSTPKLKLHHIPIKNQVV